jgi:hypothetical protein
LQTIIGRVARALRGYFHEPTTNDSEPHYPQLKRFWRSSNPFALRRRSSCAPPERGIWHGEPARCVEWR